MHNQPHPPTSPTHKQQEAVALAVREIRRLGLFGLSPSELNRYITAMLRGTYVLGLRM